MNAKLPDQPDGIDEQSRDTPSPANAAQRLREYIELAGDGLLDAIDGRPLYARDVFALVKAETRVEIVTDARDAAATSTDVVRRVDISEETVDVPTRDGVETVNVRMSQTAQVALERMVGRDVSALAVMTAMFQLRDELSPTRANHGGDDHSVVVVTNVIDESEADIDEES